MLRNSELWGGLFWLLIGGFVVWAGHDMGLGRLNRAGAGLRFLLDRPLDVRAVAQRHRPRPSPGRLLAAHAWAGTRWLKVLIVVALLLAYGGL